MPEDPTQGRSGKSRSSSSSHGNHGDEQGLPTPANLAESFLQAEPREEKEEIKAAISSQSHILRRDSSSSYDEDEDEELGLGNEATSLPSFVAGFLKGVADRLQLVIKDVAVRLDMELKQEGPSKRQPEEKPDLVSGFFSVGEINIHGVSGFSAGPDDTLPHREGKRLLSLADINFGLVSDPVVFANYSRFTSPPSPTTTMQSKGSQPLSRAPSPPLLDSPGPEENLAMTRSTIFEPPPAFPPGMSQNEHMGSSSFSNDGRFSDANSDTDSINRSTYESQILGADPFQDNPGYLDSVIDAQFDDYDDQLPPTLPFSQRSLENSGNNFNQHNLTHHSRSQNFDGDGAEETPLGGHKLNESQFYNSESHSPDQTQEGPMSYSSKHPSGEDDNFIRHLSASQESQKHRAPSSNAGSERSALEASDANLTESKFFSHDEAQSLYMSAVSQGFSSMPGAWDHSGHEERPEENTEASGGHESLPNTDGVNDNARVATPKPSGPSDSYFGIKPSLGDEPHLSQSLAPDRDSNDSTSNVGRIREIRKPILSVDHLFIWIPSALNKDEIDIESSPATFEKADSDNNGDLAYGVEESMFASKAYASTRFPRPSTEGHAFSQAGHSDHQEEDANYQQIAVEASAIKIHFDIASGWLLVKVSQNLSRAFQPQSEQPQKPQNFPPKKQDSQKPLDLTIHRIDIKLLEHVAGYPHPTEDSFPPASPPALEDVVLRMNTTGLKLKLSHSDEKTNMQLKLSKFAFGVASEDFISFNETMKMRESTRDIMSNSPDDISLTLVKPSDSAKLDVSTLPLHVNFNIQYLEEVLGWLGGLSTILELGNSISSTSTLKGAKPASKRPKGVHFETPAQAPEKEKSTPWKVNARIGGIVLDVTGDSHCLNLSTSAVKVVSRFEGIGIQIDKARLAGPFQLRDSSDAPAQVTLNNIRVEFLFAPKEVDLDRLLTLITPSKDKYDDDDDIMLDTLLRQRRQGSVLRTTVGKVEVFVSDTDGLSPLASLGSELGRLSNVTKYLPEDDRPGLLTLTLLREFNGQVQLNGDVGDVNAHMKDVEAAWISMPSLIATQVGSITVDRNDEEELLGEALLSEGEQTPMKRKPPVLMARFIPDEMDPTFKIKLHHLRAEYTVPSVMAFLGLSSDATGGELTSGMATSIANLAEQSARVTDPSVFSPSKSVPSKAPSKPMKVAVVFRDTVLGLNPRNSSSKALAVLTNAKFSGTMNKDESSEATFDIRKASLMIIDDVGNSGKLDNLHQRRSTAIPGSQIQAYIDGGYVPVTTISSATAAVKLMRLASDGTQSLDVEFKDDLLILETCADSTQTLISILNGLQPPTPPSITAKYRTEVMPIQDMLASFTGDAFSAEPGEVDMPFGGPDTELLDNALGEDLNDEIEYVSDFYPGGNDDTGKRGDAQGELLDSFHSQYQISSSIGSLDFKDDHFAQKSAVGGTAHRWDSTHNSYGLSNDQKLERSPLRVRVRDMHIIWNLFDGYDWQRTRDTISKAVEDVEAKATERRARTSRMSPDAEEDEESVIGDFLFNSIYIGIPANKDPHELHREINRDINDLASETGSYATTTTVTGATSRQNRPERGKKLRLHRSKHHKMTFELRGVSADFVVFPPGSEETQSSLDVRVKDLEIFDHVPTSTWKKFATYMHEAGERETGTCMLHLEVLTVKPVPELAASEIVLKVSRLTLL